MKIVTTRPFEKDYAALSTAIQSITDKKLALLVQNPRYPSLRIKKTEGSRNIWEGSVTKNYRFTFQIIGDMYILRRIGTHDILRTP
jgi:mRNA-degrading endonuclease RelE of RelBE toxin-antitoxin system